MVINMNSPPKPIITIPKILFNNNNGIDNTNGGPIVIILGIILTTPTENPIRPSILSTIMIYLNFLLSLNRLIFNYSSL